MVVVLLAVIVMVADVARLARRRRALEHALVATRVDRALRQAGEMAL